jgi:hypothetical protein
MKAFYRQNDHVEAWIPWALVLLLLTLALHAWNRPPANHGEELPRIRVFEFESSLRSLEAFSDTE